MERIDGEIMWPLLMSSTGGHQQQLLTLFCELFLRLHRLDWRPFVDDAARYERDRPTYAFVDGWLSEATRCLFPTFLCPDLIAFWAGCRSNGICCPARGHQAKASSS